MKKTEKRLITLSDGTGMGGELLVFRTDVPAEVLSELEKISWLEWKICHWGPTRYEVVVRVFYVLFFKKMDIIIMYFNVTNVTQFDSKDKNVLY